MAESSGVEEMMAVSDLQALPVNKVAWSFRVLNDGERQALRRSMQHDVHHAKPLTLGRTKRGRLELCDGVQRLDMAVELGITHLPVISMVFDSPEDRLHFIMASNVARRHDSMEAALWVAEYAKQLGISNSLAAEEWGVSRQRVDEAAKKLDEEPAQPAGSGKLATNNKATGKDGKVRPRTRRSTEDQIEWDQQAHDLAEEVGRQAAAEQLGCQPQTISNAVKRHKARYEEDTQDGEVVYNTDPLEREIEGAWTNFKRTTDPLEQFKITLLAGHRIKATTQIVVQTFEDCTFD